MHNKNIIKVVLMPCVIYFKSLRSFYSLENDSLALLEGVMVSKMMT